MKWDIERSNMLKERIAENEDLMRKLSSVTEEILKKYGIELKGLSYVFEPRVFQMDPGEITEIAMKSRAAMVAAISEDLVRKSSGALLDRSIIDFTNSACLPYCGPLDPITLAKLEKIRLPEMVVHKSVSWLFSSMDPLPPAQRLMNQIMGKQELLRVFSESVFEILNGYGIEFEKNEGCVFTPILFETPIFAQKVVESKKLPEVHGFGPQVYGIPTSQPAAAMKIKPFPGVIEYDKVQTVGVIIDRWWWIGIPAPEILRALDIIREVSPRKL